MRMILWVSLICIGKLTTDAALDPPGLVAVAVAHAFALFVGVSIAANISGGHLNPAVTFGLAVGGNISILTGIFYWIAQCLGSIVACLLLKFVTNGEVYFLGNKREKKIHFTNIGPKINQISWTSNNIYIFQCTSFIYLFLL